MPIEYRLPALPLGDSQVKIARWLKQPGDPLEPGDPLLVVVNDRVEVALPSPGAGILSAVLVAEGATAQVGAVVARVAPAARAAAGPRRASPVAARIAAAVNIDIETLSGSGPRGRILKRDVLAALDDRRPTTDDRRPTTDHQSPTPDPRSPISNLQSPIPDPRPLIPDPRPLIPDPRPPTPDPRPLTSMRRAIAAHMVRSRAVSPHALTAMEVDMSRVAAVRAGLKASFARRGLDLTYTACIALAAVAGLLRHPLLNSSWHDDGIVVRRRVHLGVAAALPDGLVTPVVRDAQDLNLRGMARAVGDLARRARGSALRPGETSGGTFTITNPGGGALWFGTPIINQPQAAILGVGAIEPAPLVISDAGADRIVVRPATVLTLAYDARIIDQHHADAFLREVKCRLEQFTS